MRLLGPGGENSLQRRGSCNKTWGQTRRLEPKRGVLRQNTCFQKRPITLRLGAVCFGKEWVSERILSGGGVCSDNRVWAQTRRP